ncbi:MAG TPA: phosphoribosylformylglycinamidine cyclo-ligase [Petrotogaceae bacterium]|jgi:phosphoribosylformylglycinamidine cyclo-ligase|nr:phosphoribosylformylglycinamidine cyclo-ligase [Petrotogaceae bacterium]HOG33646.1 phosphoribosylformylglycinamidine cyclo-ligase [Petrotogaceae bacterium]HPA93534.1 phosphoribosylformylglycinamidine cyclo-ligase [Petrotogaceae bacterium]HQO11735.1 phosphoribosylformylglycinamidine cyclo-ligase [Petrotogaceae bacterium]
MKDYKESGVDINEGYRTVELIRKHTKRTMIPGVLNDIGGFAGMFELKNYKNPILVSGTDGVGTKLDVAMKMKKYDTVGIDCVAMCVNDVLCNGAQPLFFLDYLACGKLDAEIAADLVKGVADGCVQAGCALIGGETAEMPGFYDIGKYDIAGFSVGVVEKDKIIDGSTIRQGDTLIGIQSSGPHSNGFSLIRYLIKDFDMPFDNRKIGEVLLTPTIIYVKVIHKVLEKYSIKGMAHITGGGFYENIPRMFATKEYTAVIKKESYEVPKIFKYIQSLGVSEKDMYNTFNMGIGFVICVGEDDAQGVMDIIKESGLDSYRLGYVKKGEYGICLE